MVKQWKKVAAVFAAAAMVLAGCSTQKKAEETSTAQATEAASATQPQEKETMDLQILATSDLHGKFDPWDYALNEESKSGSMAQIATAVKEQKIPFWWMQAIRFRIIPQTCSLTRRSIPWYWQ